ncbi:MAG: DJ-1/PfpI family protein [Kiloniellales bacterium]
MKTLAALVFPGFQTLDFYGPLEMLGDHDIGAVDIKIVAETLDPVPSYHRTRTTVDRTIAESSEYDLILIPGGDSAPLERDDDRSNRSIV